MSKATEQLSVRITRSHRDKLTRLKSETRLTIRALFESWIDAASSRLSSKKRRAKA